jgi:membrane protein implicated in regulation of membrane protease activity
MRCDCGYSFADRQRGQQSLANVATSNVLAGAVLLAMGVILLAIGIVVELATETSLRLLILAAVALIAIGTIKLVRGRRQQRQRRAISASSHSQDATSDSRNLPR